jgi:hypothetical protein
MYRRFLVVPAPGKLESISSTVRARPRGGGLDRPDLVTANPRQLQIFYLTVLDYFRLS